MHETVRSNHDIEDRVAGALARLPCCRPTYSAGTSTAPAESPKGHTGAKARARGKGGEVCLILSRFLHSASCRRLHWSVSAGLGDGSSCESGSPGSLLQVLCRPCRAVNKQSARRNGQLRVCVYGSWGDTLQQRDSSGAWEEARGPHPSAHILLRLCSSGIDRPWNLVKAYVAALWYIRPAASPAAALQASRFMISKDCHFGTRDKLTGATAQKMSCCFDGFLSPCSACHRGSKVGASRCRRIPPDPNKRVQRPAARP